jgi:hypothetical protein
LNSDHTHFIIIREQPIGSNSNNLTERKSTGSNAGEKQLEKLTDSAESATNRFRDRFEDFLHQDTSQPTTTSPVGSPPPATTTGIRTILIDKTFFIDVFQM